MSRVFVEQDENSYVSSDGWYLRREFGLTPNGNNMNGRWVLRNDKGTLIDFDQYRHDIANKHDIKLV